MGVSRTKTDGSEKQKLMRNLVTLEKCLNLNDQFQKLSLQKKFFSERMHDNIMEDDSQTLDYCMRLLRCGSNAFKRILIEKKQK